MLRVILILISIVLITGTCLGAVRFPVGQAAYVVASPNSELDKRVLGQLTTYLERVLGKKAETVVNLDLVPLNTPAILLYHAGEVNPLNLTAPAGSPEGFALATGKAGSRLLVVAVGETDRGLKRAVQRLILKSLQSQSGLEIPDLNLSEQPWIPEREYALCPWVPQYVRGVFVNPYADNRMNIWLYSDQQLANYIEMYDWFGFSGAQLMDTAYSYSVFGSPEAFQDREKTYAKMVKENGQNVSLWVWAAEFSGYGWTDPDVTYKPTAGKTAFADTQVRKGFEKYYNHYANLAPYVDRLIGHFYDPGNLEDQQDVFRYMRLLEQKFKTRQPHIKMAIDSWAAGPDYLQQLVDNGFKDYLLLEMSMPHLYKPGQREKFHQEANRLGLEVGVWGWYTTEYETDQLPSMFVNGHVLKEFYQQIKNGAAKIKPLRYWSEMDAHHINNIYSMYVAGQLLWNPDRDPDDILSELTEGIWGPQNGPKLLEALKLIEDVRSGPSWSTYWWTMPGYRLGTDSPEKDLQRSEAVINELQRVKTDETFVPKFPLPVSPATLIELMLPHLRQIHAYAEFRIELNQIRKAINTGITKEELSRRIEKAWRPIPEYNTWVGTFGQPERRMQEVQLLKLAEEQGVKVSAPGWLRAEDANRLLQKLQNMQRARRGEWRFKSSEVNEFYWPAGKLNDCLAKLVAEGWVEKVGEDAHRLVNWRNYTR